MMIQFFIVNHKLLQDAKTTLQNEEPPTIFSLWQKDRSNVPELPRATFPGSISEDIIQSSNSDPTYVNTIRREIIDKANELGKLRLSHLIRFMYN